MVAGEVNSCVDLIERVMGGIAVAEAVGKEGDGGCVGMMVLEVHAAVGPLQNVLGSCPGEDSFAQIVELELYGSWCGWEFRLEYQTYFAASQLSGWGELKREQKEIGRLVFDPGETENWESP